MYCFPAGMIPSCGLLLLSCVTKLLDIINMYAGASAVKDSALHSVLCLACLGYLSVEIAGTHTLQ